MVRYNPTAPGAKLTKPASLAVELAFNGRNWTDNQRSVAMARAADGAWEATNAILPYWHTISFAP